MLSTGWIVHKLIRGHRGIVTFLHLFIQVNYKGSPTTPQNAVYVFFNNTHYYKKVFISKRYFPIKR